MNNNRGTGDGAVRQATREIIKANALKAMYADTPARDERTRQVRRAADRAAAKSFANYTKAQMKKQRRGR